MECPEGCTFLARGDFNDCAHAGGGRGAPLTDWCKPCLLAKLGVLEAALREIDADKRRSDGGPSTMRTSERADIQVERIKSIARVALLRGKAEA
jgi:hypothetical protein